jgi:hypothetical protein
MSRLNPNAKLAVYNSRNRKNDNTRLVEQFEGTYSSSHISNVLNGRRYNSEIINAAYNMASRRMKNSQVA